MTRCSVVVGFLTVSTLSFVLAQGASANPIIHSVGSNVLGIIDVPYGGPSIYETEFSSATSGAFAADINNADVQPEGSGEYAAEISTFLSPFLIQGSGVATSNVMPVPLTGNGRAYGQTFLSLQFTLDGNYHYALNGTLSASNAHASVILSDFTGSIFPSVSFSNGVDIPFAFAGTLGAGNHFFQVLAATVLYTYTVPYQGSAAFNATLTLTPTASVPDGGHTALMFLLGSAFLGAIAFRNRRLGLAPGDTSGKDLNRSMSV